MDLAPGLDPCLSWWGPGGYSGPHSSGICPLFGTHRNGGGGGKTQTGLCEKRKLAPAAACWGPRHKHERGPLGPSAESLYPGYHVPTSYTLYQHHICQALCSSHLVQCVYSDVRSTLRPMDTLHLDRAPCTTSYLLHDALFTTYHLLNPMPTVSGLIP